MSKEKYIPEIIENTEVFDTNPPMYATTYRCPHCRELVEVKDIRRKAYKEGYEQGKFDARMEVSKCYE